MVTFAGNIFPDFLFQPPCAGSRLAIRLSKGVMQV